ncbi:MAG: HNH endonuclease [Desulfobulbaceae bacterium]|nr:HNH endonuclease [Desulfobulbaceae bacterium]
MRKCTPREIIKEVPDVQTVILPHNWFDDLGDNRSVFISLYEWMIGNGLVPSENEESLHNRTYVGEKLFKKLLSAEKKRLRKKLKIKGDELDRAVGWSDIDSGPKTEIGGCNISGDVILVIPETSRQTLGEFSAKIYRKQRDTLINKTRVNAAGATFYQWLLPQIDRPDRVGDTARAAVVDDQFPRESIQYEEIKSYLASHGACDAAIESLKESWVEYIQKYPERVQPYAWCSECGKKFDVKNALLAWSLESRELFVLDTACLNKYMQFDELVSRPLLGITHDDLSELVEKDEVSELDANDMIEQLNLWGIIPIASEGCNLQKTVSRKYTRRPISNSKRYVVLRRDKFQCVLCGASGSEANLEVDHIVPVSRGGTNDIGNLRCLCFKCNRGKHSKIE